jgi:hypothetical protein
VARDHGDEFHGGEFHGGEFHGGEFHGDEAADATKFVPSFFSKLRSIIDCVR